MCKANFRNTAVDVNVDFTFFCASRHARVAHNRHRVLPVPVGLSKSAFALCRVAAIWQNDLSRAYHRWAMPSAPLAKPV